MHNVIFLIGKTITGLLTADGLRVSEKRVGKALKRVSFHYHTQRQQNLHAQINPTPYTAAYFGQKLHTLTKMKSL